MQSDRSQFQKSKSQRTRACVYPPSPKIRTGWKKAKAPAGKGPKPFHRSLQPAPRFAAGSSHRAGCHRFAGSCCGHVQRGLPMLRFALPGCLHRQHAHADRLRMHHRQGSSLRSWRRKALPSEGAGERGMPHRPGGRDRLPRQMQAGKRIPVRGSLRSSKPICRPFRSIPRFLCSDLGSPDRARRA